MLLFAHTLLVVLCNAAGLLAGLALRYDASRMVNMQARATAAAAAIGEALAALQPDASAQEMGNAAASAASSAYDKVCNKDVTNAKVTGWHAVRLAHTSSCLLIDVGWLTYDAAPCMLVHLGWLCVAMLSRSRCV
jgi:hypothetical protein